MFYPLLTNVHRLFDKYSKWKLKKLIQIEWYLFFNKISFYLYIFSPVMFEGQYIIFIERFVQLCNQPSMESIYITVTWKFLSSEPHFIEVRIGFTSTLFTKFDYLCFSSTPRPKEMLDDLPYLSNNPHIKILCNINTW